MFSDLAKIFSRDFLVGYFLPASMFTAATAFLFALFNPPQDPLIGAVLSHIQGVWVLSIALFAAWLLAILLISVNRGLVRLSEGYGILERTPLKRIQEKQFDDLIKKIQGVEQKYGQEQIAGNVQRSTRSAYHKLISIRRGRYPSEREFLLPTRLGNVIRAFETYPREVYGLDAIPVWTRIIAVVPKDYREVIADARAQFDFTINLVWLSILALLEYGGLAWATSKAPLPWIPLVLLLSAWTSYETAISGAAEWGETVKTVFDLYRGDLLKQMGLEVPKSAEEERHYWTCISRAFLYWEKSNLPLARLTKGSKQPE